MKHLLLTNDFPPKLGGIQSYLWELWRRLAPGDVTVFAGRFAGSDAWDRSQGYRIERHHRTQFLPTRTLARDVDRLADEVGAELVLIDPAFPVGLVARWLDHPYGVVLHGAEVTVPGRLPVTRQALGSVLRGAEIVICAGSYPVAEGMHAAGRELPVVNVPPGVDVERFVPLQPSERDAARSALGVERDAELVLSLSRLVPRKGMDVLIAAAARLRRRRPRLEVLIGGDGRDRARLERKVAKTDAPVRFLGRVEDSELPDLYGCADLYVMLCRNRWFGLEQEGFGIVFLEAAACGIPQIAGRSGGSHEAVVDAETGLVLPRPRSARAAEAAIGSLLEDADLRSRMAVRSRERAVRCFTYDVLAQQLAEALDTCEGGRS